MNNFINFLTFSNYKKVEVILTRTLLATWIPSFITQNAIDLSKRKISLIDARAFSQLSHITSLNLGTNFIKAVDSLIFTDLVNLLKLNLDNNALTRIEASTFSRLTKLTFLTLNNNNLLAIDRLAFVGLTNLEYVNLASNPITLTQPSLVLQLCQSNPKCVICINSTC
jgi:Leucine-rich repeat (LRR) protein